MFLTENEDLRVQHAIETARKCWGLPLYSNPVLQVRKPSPSAPRKRRLSPSEQAQLLNEAEKCRNTFLAPIIRFALATGMRRGEILAARWEHFDSKAKTLLLPHTKNGHSREVPLSPDAIAAIMTMAGRDSECIFPTTENALRLAWQRVIKRCEIEDLHFHDLRHEAISRLFEYGLSVAEVALISGHRDVRMLFRYTHLEAAKIAAKLGHLEARKDTIFLASGL